MTTNLHCYQTYSPHAHPQYSLASGKLLVSIAWNGCDLFQDTANDARFNKPRFHEVVIAGVPVYLTSKLSGGALVLSWPLGTSLEVRTPNGPWTTNNATSPHTNNLSAISRFYRVKVQ